MSAGRALVIGGSVAGLLCALLLRRQGWAVSVHERALGDLAGRGAGLGVSQELLDVMARAGAPFAPWGGVPQRSHVWMAKDGSVRFEHRRNLMASAWARVYQPLRAALPPEVYRQNSVLQRVEQDPSGVTAFFAGGRHETADLLVAADGALSTVRRQYLAGSPPSRVAWCSASRPARCCFAWSGPARARRRGRASGACASSGIATCRALSSPGSSPTRAAGST